MIRLTFTEDVDFLAKREQCLEYLQKHRIDVGLTSSASSRSRFLLAIHTRGSPIMRIPPRPAVKPALSRESLRAEMAVRPMKDTGVLYSDFDYEIKER